MGLESILGGTALGTGLTGGNMSELPIVGSMFPDEDTQRMQREMEMGARSLSAYRPEAYQARRNAMNNRMSSLQGANNILTQMSGGNQPFNPAAVQAPIMGPSMFAQGRSKAIDTPQKQQSMLDRGQMLSDMYYGQPQGVKRPPQVLHMPDGSVFEVPQTSGLPPDIWGAEPGAFDNPDNAKFFDSSSPYYIKNQDTYQKRPSWDWDENTKLRY